MGTPLVLQVDDPAFSWPEDVTDACNRFASLLQHLNMPDTLVSQEIDT